MKTKRLVVPMLLGLLASFTALPCQKKKPKRPCLQCGALHHHNNSFCSSRCCKAYRAIRSGQR